MANVFNRAKLGIMDADIDIQDGTFEIMLFTTAPVGGLSSALQNLTTVALVEADAAFVEATDASYTANGDTGRIVVGAITTNQDDPNDRAEADTADITYTALDSFTIKGAIVYDQTGAAGPAGDATHIPVAYYVLDQLCNGGDIILQVDAQGFLHLS